MTRAHPPTGQRAVPYHCPFCADEDLRPLGTTPGAWHCRSCLRAFSVTFLGLADHGGPDPTAPEAAPPIPHDVPDPDAPGEPR